MFLFNLIQQNKFLCIRGNFVLHQQQPSIEPSALSNKSLSKRQHELTFDGKWLFRLQLAGQQRKKTFNTSEEEVKHGFVRQRRLIKDRNSNSAKSPPDDRKCCVTHESLVEWSLQAIRMLRRFSQSQLQKTPKWKSFAGITFNIKQQPSNRATVSDHESSDFILSQAKKKSPLMTILGSLKWNVWCNKTL